MSKSEPAGHAIPIDYLRECFFADGSTLRWQARPARHFPPVPGKRKVGAWKRKSGQSAGSPNGDGYLQVMLKFNGKRYSLAAHRILWALHYGAWPAGCIDHINGLRTDNRIENLRDVPVRINTQNQRAAMSSSKTGVLGVSKVGARYLARIRHQGRLHHLGSFSTSEEAHESYLRAKRQLHEGCTI